jgi:uncharacterized membrane protein
MGTKTFIGGVTIGAGLVYLLDPEKGEMRRQRLSQSLTRLLEEARYGFVAEPEQAVVETHRYGSRIGDIDGLGSATLPLPQGAESTPVSNIALQVAGAVLAFYGFTRRGTLATMLRTLGTGILFGGVGRAKLGLSGSSVERRRAVDIQKTLHINAPIEQVYAFWTNYENFPLFMSNVRAVEDLGDGRSHWSISGPGGMPIEWDAVLTQQAAGEVIAWRSEPGSMLENAGMIRFSTAGTGTRVDLRLCYHPPAGGAGQAVAELLGSDPRAKLNEDLGRMKSLLEATNRSEAHGKKSKS